MKSKDAHLLNHEDAATACVLCSSTCGLRVDVKDGKIEKVRPDPSNPVTQGYACNKAATIGHYVDHAERVTVPLRRTPDGSFVPISWEQAIEEIAAKLKATLSEHGPQALSLVGIGGQANHMGAAFGLGLFTGLGGRKWFNAFAQEKTQNSLVDGWMCQASPSAFFHPDAEHADVLLVLGTNARISNRGHNAGETLRAISRDPSRTLIVVDPRETETSRDADLHLAVRPGGDVYVLLGMAALLAQKDLTDGAFLKRWTRDSDALLHFLRGIDTGEMASRAGLCADTLADVTERFARGKRSAILWDLGIEQNRYSTLNAYLIRVLSVLTGNFGQRGGNVFLPSVAPKARAQASTPPARALVSGIEAIRALGEVGMFSPNLFPEEVLTAHPDRIRAVIVEGANPLLSYSDTAQWRKAFNHLDLKVVIEPAMTETARMADYVLPTPVGYEKWEICGFPHGFPEIAAQVRAPVVPAPPGALPEPEIYARLADALNVYGKPPALLRWAGRRATSDRGRKAFTALTLLCAARFAKDSQRLQNAVLFWSYSTLGRRLPDPALVAIWWIGMGHALSRRKAVVAALGKKFRRKSLFTLGAEIYQRLLDHPEGAVIAKVSVKDHLRESISHKDGRIRLLPKELEAELSRAANDTFEGNSDYPFVLSAGVRTRWTANTIQRDPAWRKGKGPQCALRLHPTDAKAVGLTDGGAVTLSTETGSVTLPAVFDAKLRPGHVTVPNGFGAEHSSGDGVQVDGVNLNELTRATYRDPFTGCPYHKHVPCSLKPG